MQGSSATRESDVGTDSEITRKLDVERPVLGEAEARSKEPGTSASIQQLVTQESWRVDVAAV